MEIRADLDSKFARRREVLGDLAQLFLGADFSMAMRLSKNLNLAMKFKRWVLCDLQHHWHIASHPQCSFEVHYNKEAGARLPELQTSSGHLFWLRPLKENRDLAQNERQSEASEIGLNSKPGA
eukprot:1157900-Pelagomonas_calceolata.AAC.5